MNHKYGIYILEVNLERFFLMITEEEYSKIDKFIEENVEKYEDCPEDLLDECCRKFDCFIPNIAGRTYLREGSEIEWESILLKLN